MKKLILLLGFLLALTGCTVISPGYVGIKVNNWGSQKGVEDFPVQTGWIWFNPFSETIIHYPSFVQTAVWTKDKNEGSSTNEEITFNSKEGLVISGDISLSYRLDRDSIPSFYIKFRSDDLHLFTHGFLRNIARDAFNETAVIYTVEEIYGSKKEEMLTVIKKKINLAVRPFGVILEQFGFTGALRIPEAVVDALNSKIKATQDAIRIENELRQAEAEARKKIASAEGESKANAALAESITPNLLKWKQMGLTEKAIAKWDGKRPMVEGNSSGLILNLSK